MHEYLGDYIVAAVLGLSALVVPTVVIWSEIRKEARRG